MNTYRVIYWSDFNDDDAKRGGYNGMAMGTLAQNLIGAQGLTLNNTNSGGEIIMCFLGELWHRT